MPTSPAMDGLRLACTAGAFSLGDPALRAFVDCLPDAKVLVDGSGVVRLANGAAHRLLGYTPGTLIGVLVDDLLPHDLRGAHRGHRAGFMTAPQPRAMAPDRQLSARRADGSLVAVDVSLGVLPTEEGPIVIAGLRDVTERRSAESAAARHTADLQRSNEDLEQFAYIASHDLQEPLRMVASYTELLERRYTGRLDADADEFLRFAADGARRMRVLINDLLTYSRVGRDAVRTAVPLDRPFAWACDNLGAAIRESGADVRHDGLPTVWGDPAQLGRLLQNLIGNALKFRGDARPDILVHAAPDPAGWRLEVRDNGIGIEPRHHDRIFAIFQRLHSRADYPGTGIGLALCRRIVEWHGGRLWVRSAPGQGSSFFFTLPAAPAAGPEGAA